jgi:hypothetical protein
MPAVIPRVKGISVVRVNLRLNDGRSGVLASSSVVQVPTPTEVTPYARMTLPPQAPSSNVRRHNLKVLPQRPRYIFAGHLFWLIFRDVLPIFVLIKSRWLDCVGSWNVSVEFE